MTTLAHKKCIVCFQLLHRASSDSVQLWLEFPTKLKTRARVSFGCWLDAVPSMHTVLSHPLYTLAFTTQQQIMCGVARQVLGLASIPHMYALLVLKDTKTHMRPPSRLQLHAAVGGHQITFHYSSSGHCCHC